MNRFTSPIRLTACVFALLCLASIGQASPPSATHDGHFHLPLNLEDMRSRDSLYAASKHALNLNVGEPRTVRMIYFLPNDRPYRAEIVQKMKDEIRHIQTFYRDQMRAHGHGAMTFRFETDAQGEPLVHRVDGQYPDSHYLDNTSPTVLAEVEQVFDLLANNVYFIVVDNSTDAITTGRTAGVGTGERNRGYALVTHGFNWQIAAHELGHAFGLWHDFRDGGYIMSYGPGWDRLSSCHAEYLSAHPYFNPDIPNEDTPAPTIELISPPEYLPGATSVSIQLRVGDPDGLHQVLLLVRPGEVKACRGLNGERDTIVQFDYDGVIPSEDFTSLSHPIIHPIYAWAVDTNGNVGRLFFELWETPERPIATFKGHTDIVRSVAFSPDDTTLASGSDDGNIKLWNVLTGRNIATFDGHIGWVSSVAFSPDGTMLASGNLGTARLWDILTRTNTVVIERNSGIPSVAFSPDGTTLASGSADGTVTLVDIATGTNIATLEGHVGYVGSVAFSPDGTILASGSWDDTVKLWDVATGTNIATLGGQVGVNSVAFSPDGTLLAAGTEGPVIKLWDISTGTNIAALEGHVGPVYSVAFSPNGTTIASGSWEGTIKLWDVVTSENFFTIRGPKSVRSVSFSPNGTLLATGAEDGVIKLWDISEWIQPRPRRPWTLVKISGDEQEGSSGEALMNPFIVEVRDQYGNPLQGTQVAFTVTEGEGRLSGRFTVENATTDANGRAQSTLTLGPNSRTNIVEASVAGIEATFKAVGVGTTTGPITRGDYQTWQLPNGALIRLGNGGNRAIAFSPDGQLFAVASSIGVWLYDVATSRKRALLTGHAGIVTSVAFSPDGKILASGSDDKTVKLWDVATKQNIATLEGHTSTVTSVAFSPDGKTLASGSWDDRVKLWDVATKQNIATLEGHTSTVTSVAFSPDGKTLASGSWDDRVKLWDVATKQNIATLTEPTTNLISSVAFSPDGTILAVAAQDVRLWDVATRQYGVTLEEHKGYVSSVAFSPDGKTLATGASDETVKLWDTTTRNHITLSHTESYLVAFSPDGKTLATEASDETVKLWDVATRQNIATLEGHIRKVRSIAFSPDGKTLATGATRSILLWDVATRQNIATLDQRGRTFSFGIRSIAFSPDGKTLATGTGGDLVDLWDVATRRNITVLRHPNWVRSVAFSPDGTILASVSDSGPIKLWNVSTWAHIATFEGGRKTIAFSPDGTTLASGSWGSTVKLWDIATRTEIATLEGHTDEITSVAFSPDGTTLASGSWGSTVKLWDIATRTEIATLEGHTDEITSVAFSPDGTILASGADDGTVLLWDMSPYISPLMSDFDGDRRVGFPDFLLFVAQFGLSHADEGYEARFDLDGDGAVGFGDFLIFASHFGKAVSPPGPSGG